MQNLEIFSVLIKIVIHQSETLVLRKCHHWKYSFFSKMNLFLILRTTYRFGDQISAAPNNFVYKFEIKKNRKNSFLGIIIVYFL